MRVIAGRAKSRRLIIPKSPPIRPTTDMVREALFASLGPRIIEARFGDLYAGSGSVGIEALSRGAAHCVFIEKDRRCIQAIKANLAATGLSEYAEIIWGDVLRCFASIWERTPLDIVFLDPPYRQNAEPALRLVWELAQKSAHSCLIIVQCEQNHKPALVAHKIKQFGSTQLLYYEVAEKALWKQEPPS